MDDQYPLCEAGYDDHVLTYQNRFSLYCSGVRIVLGPTYDVARTALERRCGQVVADGLFAAFGPPKIIHRIFHLAGGRHATGPDCEACPHGWPVKCTEHGGCDGQLHATLRSQRNQQTYTRRSQLPPADVTSAYRNLLVRGRFEHPRPTPFQAETSCDHCCSQASRGEVQQALINAVGPSPRRREG